MRLAMEQQTEAREFVRVSAPRFGHGFVPQLADQALVVAVLGDEHILGTRPAITEDASDTNIANIKDVDLPCASESILRELDGPSYVPHELKTTRCEVNQTASALDSSTSVSGNGSHPLPPRACLLYLAMTWMQAR